MDLLQTHLWMSDLIYRAGDRIKVIMKQDLEIQEKSSFRDLVTNVDKEIEDFFIANIKARFPEHRIMGEESVDHQFSSLEGMVWIIDPIDGTMNFIKQQDNFGIMISLFQNGVGLLGYIYDVMRDKMCFAIKGYGAYVNGMRLPKAGNLGMLDLPIIVADCVMRSDVPQTKALLQKTLAFRSLGSSALAEIAVFEGKVCAYFSYKISPWDISPSVMIAKELGYLTETVDGQPADLLRQNTCIIGTEKAVREIQAIAGELKSQAEGENDNNKGFLL
ncbi:inositol monophosphatase family protein [Clostridiales bacterium COT073_COT-073]|nr:inositol monophosphatase family protein [Clostridiales bacterium COT073_COT-073]